MPSANSTTSEPDVRSFVAVARPVVADRFRGRVNVDRLLRNVCFLIVRLQIFFRIEVRSADDAIVLVRVSHTSLR